MDDVRVRDGVLTDLGTNISPDLNAVAGEHATQYLGVLIAESNVREQALREGKWPDYSAGLSQVIAPNLGYGTYQKEATPSQKAAYRAYMFEPANAIREGWRYYKVALDKHGDPLWAALGYNRGPSYTTEQLKEQVATQPAIASRFERYRQSLLQAEAYAMTDEFVVGEGVRAKMAERGDVPRSDENYVRPNISETFGDKGVYYYYAVTNETHAAPFE